MTSNTDASPQTEGKQLQTRRKHLRECQKALGPLGFRIFKEFAFLDGDKGSMRQLVWWVEGWDKAGNLASRGKPFHKVSISNWRSAVLSCQQPPSRVPGLAFYVRRIQLIGRPAEGWAWGGVLLLMYGRQTHLLFHYVAANDKTSSFPAGILWYALDKAASLLRDKKALSALHTKKKTVFLPQGTNYEAAFLFFAMPKYCLKTVVARGDHCRL